MGKRKFTIGAGLANAFSVNLYHTPQRALGEIIGNGRDACIKKNAPIEIHINTYSDSPWFSGATLVVTDRGCGFPSDSAWDEYLLIGDSASQGREDLFGVNGIGKFAPLYFARRYTVRTCADSGMDLTVVHVDKERIFTADFQFMLGRRGDLPTDPEQGSFTSIIIEDMERPYAPDQIVEDLKNELVIEERIITINGAPLPERETIGDALVIHTPAMPKIGKVSGEIRLVEKTLAIDNIMLLGGGRQICPLNELPVAYRRMLDQVFFHPNLIGWINVDKWLKKSTISKDRVRSDALSKAEWSSFLKTMKLYFQKPLSELVSTLNTESDRGDQTVKTLRTVTSLFQKVWPVDPGQVQKLGFGDGVGFEEQGVAATRKPNKPGGKKNPPGVPSGKGGTKGTTKNPGQGTGTRKTSNPTFLIQIQGEVYKLYPARTAEQFPAFVKRGNIVVIDLKHPAFLRIKSRGINAVLTFLERVIVEAHVLYKFPGEGPSVCFAQVNALLSQMK